MSSVFLLQNQHKFLLSKQGEWVDGREAAALFRTPHRDEALNHMIETNARDYTLRMKILECPLNDRGLPLLQDDDLPPLAVVAAARQGNETREGQERQDAATEPSELAAEDA